MSQKIKNLKEKAADISVSIQEDHKKTNEVTGEDLVEVVRDISPFLKDLLDQSIENFSNGVSPVGGSVKVKSVKEVIKNAYVDLEFHMMREKEVVKIYKITSDQIMLPYYFSELIKIVLISYWSGADIKKRDRNRYLFLLEYGEKNKHYLNKNLRRVHFLKTLVKPKLKKTFGGNKMKKDARYNKEAVKAFVKTNQFIKFRYDLLINFEGKTEDEALETIYHKQIKYDGFHMREYNNIKKTLAQPTP